MLRDLDHETSKARQEKREQIIKAASALVGSQEGPTFDPVHAPLCAIDVVMVAGAPWLKDSIERDFNKDESGYRKIGGGANTPEMAYFFRSTTNLMHFLKRQGLYIPRGAKPDAAAGMACFLDWDDRGRFNFAPDRSGIIVKVQDGHVTEFIGAQKTFLSNGQEHFVVQRIPVPSKSRLDLAIIGYSDLP